MSSYTAYNGFVHHAFSSGLDKYHGEKKTTNNKKMEAKGSVACNHIFLQYCVVSEESFNKIISTNKFVNVLLNICVMIHSSIDMLVNKRGLSLKRPI